MEIENFPFRLYSYGPASLSKQEEVPGEFFSGLSGADGRVHWIDVVGLRDESSIRRLCTAFGIHHLIAEDILNSNQMVKMDSYDDCLFLVLKRISYSSEEQAMRMDQISLILKSNCVISFQEEDRDAFGEVRKKITGGRDRIRKGGADYLCYELINTVVDHYFQVIDELGDVTDSIEEELIANPAKGTLQRIYYIKRKLMFLRKSVFPLREIVGKLANGESEMLSDSIRIYFRDVYDHLIQIVDSIETFQDILSNMLDIYLSSVSNRTNDTMKILTIFSTIFIPLTFLAGIYGMNFKNIPELNLPYGYALFWVLSALIAGCMLWFFHRKKWF